MLTFPVERVGFIDFETRCRLPITAGTYRYACAADAIVLSYAIGTNPAAAVAVERFDGAPLGWDPPPDLRAHAAAVAAGRGIWAAWNAGFDKAIWNYSTVRFPALPPHHIIDVMAQAAASGLPSDLFGAARACGTAEKDAAGGELLKLFCLPEATGTPQSHPAQWRDLIRYAQRDVEAMRDVFLHTRQLPLAEWQEYWAIEAINEAGIGIDLTLAQHAARLADEDHLRSRDELISLTGGEVESVDQVARMTRWLLQQLKRDPESCKILTARSEEINDNGELVRPAAYALTRRRVERLLTSPGLSADVRRVLQIRLYGGAKTPAKFRRMQDQHVDGVLFGQYVFNGAAQTGRMSSKGVQIHNLARDCLKREADTITATSSGASYAALQSMNPNDPVVRQLSLLIRPTFVPVGENNVFVWSDWAQIEARVLPWLAGQSPGAVARLEAFAAVDRDPSLPDLYTRTAATLSSLAINAVTPEIRQRGKVAELALGFGGSVGALQAMGANFGLHFDDSAARKIVDKWRIANRWCVDFWDDLERAAIGARKLPGVEFPVGRLKYVFLRDYLGGSLCCELPSGRSLTYRALRSDLVEEEDEDGHKTKSMQLRFSRAHGRSKVWRGLLCENVVQAVAADVLRGTLVALARAKVPVRATTHDEVLIEADINEADSACLLLRTYMRRGFAWSSGLPLMSEETIAPYYTKDKSVYYADERQLA
jgi:DNA polymerase bacteriophage-type